MEAATQSDKGQPVQPSKIESPPTPPESAPSSSTTLPQPSIHYDVSQETNVNVIVKHGGAEYRIENLLQDHTIEYLKSQIEELTNVRICRQKLFGIKSKDGKPVTDMMMLEETNIIDGMKFMMMGSQEKEIENVEQAYRHRQPIFEDDYDLDEDDVDTDARIPKEPLYMAKISRRVKHYKIKMINQPRPDKKLLVLDIDYTLFDHRSTAQSAAELMRPHLHEFLTSAYQDYDIVIWSATSMRYIEAKMDELRVSSNPNYKIVFYLDSGAMISVESQKYGNINVKPLAVIWGKFPGQYTPKNTIMFDDTRRNFLMNPQNGLKIKAFREAWKNRDSDQELLYLSKYLARIAAMDDLSSLNHKHWDRSIDGPKRHKTSK